MKYIVFLLLIFDSNSAKEEQLKAFIYYNE